MTLPVGAFTLAVTPGSQLVHGPATTTWQVTVTSTAGFIGPVTLSCAGFPTDGSCTFAQNPVLLTSGSTAVTTMSVVNTETDAVLRAPALPGRPMQLAPLTAAIALPYELGGIGILAFALQRRNRKQLTRLLLLAVAVGMIGLAGCGCPNTAFHTYTLTVTGTAVPGGPAAQSVQVLLSVGQ